MMAVMPAVGVPVMVAIMRGGRIASLRLGGSRTILRRRLHGRCLLHRHKQRRRWCE